MSVPGLGDGLPVALVSQDAHGYACECSPAASPHASRAVVAAGRICLVLHYHPGPVEHLADTGFGATALARHEQRLVAGNHPVEDAGDQFEVPVAHYGWRLNPHNPGRADRAQVPYPLQCTGGEHQVVSGAGEPGSGVSRRLGRCPR